MSGELAQVRLVGLPIEVHRRATEHQEAVRRELAFVDEAADPTGIPSRLATLAAELSARYAGHTMAPTDALAAALESGASAIDLDYELPADAADGAARLAAMLDEVDQYCVDGKLLTLVPSPESLAYRRWFLEEFIEQIRDGRPPRPWADVAAPLDGATPDAGGAALDGATITTAGAAGASTVTVAVDDDLDLALAARLRGELVGLIEAGAIVVVFDLASCRFMDSAGLSLLITARARVGDQGGRLRVVGATDAVRRTFERAGVVDLLGVE